MTHSAVKGVNGLENPSFMVEDGDPYRALSELDAKGPEEKKKDQGKSYSTLVYSVTDIPPWYLCILLGIQHYLTALGGLVAIPLILSKELCLQHDPLTQGHLISTIFFVSGICTLLQVFFGVRLPILQGGTFAFLTPSLAMLSLPNWKCPAWTQNASQVNATSPEFIEVWQSRIREVNLLQGAIMVASCFQIFVGFSGLIGLMMRFIGPLTIAPTITLVALPLFNSAGDEAGSHWGISAMAIFFIVLFSQYLKNVPVPLPSYQGSRKCHFSKVYLFQIFPVLLGLAITWLICFVLTVTSAFPSDPAVYGYPARTDIKGDVLSQAPWFRFPYPGRESNSDRCWWLRVACNRHVWEDRCCVRQHTHTPDWRIAPCDVWNHHCCRGFQFAGDNGVASSLVDRIRIQNSLDKLENWSEINKVKLNKGKCKVLLVGKRNEMDSYQMKTNWYVDMNSSRNLFIFGFSIYAGLAIPSWVTKNSQVLETGILQLDQVIRVLLTTGMFVGGFLAFVLDNTIPGSQEERGLLAWKETSQEECDEARVLEVYNLPFGIGTKFCTFSWAQYLPTCPQRLSGTKRKEEPKNLKQENSFQINSEREPEIDIDTRM
ncbi:solute carrier family 23 member 1-like isoform X4 [Pelodiscus sinensis]|uniref:solute carrier family 23 member 1-like isoform X4 n=1 Tax=Pelodiscus sinensis TaxID=13735 RepID=UPI003F6AB664